ncbi:hypothetical protein CPB84DRAFT_1855071 [Gymnopilus junonius]|uniref:Uncharacterized protein n=1 Tax=Gymnopilus junonius TaxID=109634 RepID=A0A9P5NA83_GYMJU|nr:hypothetical protein CPB84DRAFT_1855071 [Gymnopilus junonius]
MPQQTPPLDHSRGRAFISDGDIYYSPNCSRSVAVPNWNPSYPFAVGAASLRWHQTPEWWTDVFGFLSFTPSVPSFEGYVFGHLCDYLNNINEVDTPWGTGYQLQQSKSSAWCYLEDILIVILHILREKFFLQLKPYFLPPPPSLLGFDQVFFSARGARYRIGCTRDWFIVWIGLLSFYIACIEGEPDPLQVPDWFNFLASEKEVDQLWLSRLYDVIMSVFWRQTHHTGSFIDLTNKGGEGADLVKWLCVWNVPVWYHWLEVEQGQTWRRAFAYIQPPPEHLQNVMTLIYRSPSPPSMPPTTLEQQPLSSPNLPHHSESSILPELEFEKAWEAGSQACYDSFQNEWDLCEYFATPGDPDCISNDDDDGDGNFGPDFGNYSSTSHSCNDSPNSQQKKAMEFVAQRVEVHAGVIPLPAPLLSNDENGLNLIPSQVVDIVAYLFTHYGYRPTIAIPPNPSTPDKARWNDLVKTVGLRAKDSNPPPVDFGLSCFDFLQGLQMTNGPLPIIYDLKHQCPIALNIAALRLLFQKVGDLFLLQGSCLALDPQAPWMIALTTATDVVKVFCLVVSPGKHSSMSLACCLLEMGMTFFTLLLLQHQPSIRLQAH